MLVNAFYIGVLISFPFDLDMCNLNCIYILKSICVFLSAPISKDTHQVNTESIQYFQGSPKQGIYPQIIHHTFCSFYFLAYLILKIICHWASSQLIKLERRRIKENSNNLGKPWNDSPNSILKVCVASSKIGVDIGKLKNKTPPATADSHDSTRVK